MYSLSNIIRVIKPRSMGWAGHVECVGDRIGAWRILVGKPVGRRPYRRPRRGWEYKNEKGDRSEDMDCMDLLKDEGQMLLFGEFNNELSSVIKCGASPE
jgi:hypothetical protein